MDELPSYSIAIRTLGTVGDIFKQELESICLQTVKPERVLVYIAEGYPRPSFSVGEEEYIWVKKGMIAQRTLHYDEISSDCILTLDDDVLLAPNSAELLLRAIKENDVDAVGADAFKNHEMGLGMKVYAAFTNLVFPHCSRKWALKVHRNGSFSYNNHPFRPFYYSQRCEGPAILWKKEALISVHLEDEEWLDELVFAYLEDTLETYKLYFNGGKLGLLYNAGIIHLDAGASSGDYKKDPRRFYIRTKASFMVWWRMCFRNGADTSLSRILAATSYGIKFVLLIPAMCIAALVYRRQNVICSYFKGVRDGWREVHSEPFRSLPPYYMMKKEEIPSLCSE